MSVKPRILALATRWGPLQGGVNAFNAELCAAFSGRGCEVMCVVLQADGSDYSDATSKGVKLRSLDIASDDFSPSLGGQLDGLLKTENIFPNIWIGHDLITGPAMISAHSLQKNGSRLLIHHMHYLSYK